MTELREHLATAELTVRQEWAMNHGCPAGSIYGDDGELSCAACRTDFRRTPFLELSLRVSELRSRSMGAQLKLWEEWRERALKSEEKLAAAEKLAEWANHRWSCEVRQSDQATRKCDCGYQELREAWERARK